LISNSFLYEAAQPSSTQKGLGFGEHNWTSEQTGLNIRFAKLRFTLRKSAKTQSDGRKLTDKKFGKMSFNFVSHRQ